MGFASYKSLGISDVVIPCVCNAWIRTAPSLGTGLGQAIGGLMSDGMDQRLPSQLSITMSFQCAQLAKNAQS